MMTAMMIVHDHDGYDGDNANADCGGGDYNDDVVDNNYNEN